MTALTSFTMSITGVGCNGQASGAAVLSDRVCTRSDGTESVIAIESVTVLQQPVMHTAINAMQSRRLVHHSASICNAGYSVPFILVIVGQNSAEKPRKQPWNHRSTNL